MGDRFEIKLSIKNCCGEATVVARSHEKSTGKAIGRGDIAARLDDSGQEKLTWTTVGNNKFKIHFDTLGSAAQCDSYSNSATCWPCFEGKPADGYLAVDKDEPGICTFTKADSVKYSVFDASGAAVPLDPMIVIRPNSLITNGGGPPSYTFAYGTLILSALIAAAVAYAVGRMTARR
jgi:hypothetical protein